MDNAELYVNRVQWRWWGLRSLNAPVLFIVIIITLCLKKTWNIFIFNNCQTSTDFNKIWHGTSPKCVLQMLIILSTSPSNCNYTTLWNTHVLFQQFTTVWRCQKWHCLKAFNAVIKHAASSATKCILDIPPHPFLCSYCTSQTQIHDVDDLKHRLIAAWSGCSSQSLTRSLTSGVNGYMPAWKLMDDTLSTCC